MSETPCEAYLEESTGAGPQRHRLEPGAICRIGRDAQNTIVLADKQVSRKHALVQRAKTGECSLLDLRSRNGTFVNCRRVSGAVLLEPGDRIAIGGCELVFRGPAVRASTGTSTEGATVAGIDQRLITALVADIRDFTGLSVALSEVKVSMLVRAFVCQCGTILTHHGASGQKYIGDAVMAFWLHNADTPALSEIRSVFEALHKTFAAAADLQRQFDLNTPVRIGAGINTGFACIGNLGSEALSDYTAISDAVNLTFRLESATKEIGSEVALGRATYDFLARQYDLPDIFRHHKVSLKGYREPKDIYGISQLGLAALLNKFDQDGCNPRS